MPRLCINGRPSGLKSKSGNHSMATRFWFLLVVVAFLNACSSRPSHTSPEPGTELFAILPENITEVRISSSDYKVYAFRWQLGQPFEVVTSSRKGRNTEHCTGGAAFDDLLKSLSTVKILRAADKPFDAGSNDWADVDLRDATVLEPISMRVRVPRSAGETVVVQVENRQFVADIDGSALMKAKFDCQAFRK